MVDWFFILIDKRRAAKVQRDEQRSEESHDEPDDEFLHLDSPF